MGNRKPTHQLCGGLDLPRADRPDDGRSPSGPRSGGADGRRGGRQALLLLLLRLRRGLRVMGLRRGVLGVGLRAPGRAEGFPGARGARGPHGGRRLGGHPLGAPAADCWGARAGALGGLAPDADGVKASAGRGAVRGAEALGVVLRTGFGGARGLFGTGRKRCGRERKLGASEGEASRRRGEGSVRDREHARPQARGTQVGLARSEGCLLGSRRPRRQRQGASVRRGLQRGWPRAAVQRGHDKRPGPSHVKLREGRWCIQSESSECTSFRNSLLPGIRGVTHLSLNLVGIDAAVSLDLLEEGGGFRTRCLDGAGCDVRRLLDLLHIPKQQNSLAARIMHMQREYHLRRRTRRNRV